MLAGDAEAGEEYVAGDPYTGSMIIVSMMPPSEAPRELPRTPYRRSSQNFSCPRRSVTCVPKTIGFGTTS